MEGDEEKEFYSLFKIDGINQETYGLAQQLYARGKKRKMKVKEL